MSLLKIPCKECITLAICKTKGTIDCPLLKEMFDKDHNNHLYDEVEKLLGSRVLIRIGPVSYVGKSIDIVELNLDSM